MQQENLNKVTDRNGITNKMHNGMLATIIEYRKSTDMDIQFEDGKIRYGVQYEKFQRGGFFTS